MRVLILFVLLSTALAVPRKPARIVGGESTSIDQYPYMSSMLYNLWGIMQIQFCGGTLITKKSILSAAHCYAGDSPNEWSVRLGSTQASSGGSVYDVIKLIIHTQYNSRTIINDIAIVKLASAVETSDTIGIARIAGPNYNLADGTKVTAIGWGALWSGGIGSEELQKVDVDVINHKECTERYENLKSLPGFQNWPSVVPEMLCIGILDVGGKDACQGDSGGPVVHDGDVIVGITSWGYGCAHAEYPGVNVRVSSYTKWIESNAY